ncbi:MAG TPA: hypothetical protein ENK23_06280 [Sorangium sp.]|nr:hypothetical protein [Sorangium sp.]
MAATLLCAACSDDDAGPVVDPPPAWQVVLDDADIDRVALSVWGTSASDVFVVGGPLGNTGLEAMVLHFDGSGWKDLAPGGADTFWWVAGTASDDVWMVGEKGRITHYDGHVFVDHMSAVTATIWGVWPFAADDVWAVGGTPGGGTAAPNDIVLHYDGSSWTKVALPVEKGLALNKVWGPAPGELYAVGEKGTTWHLKDGSWADESAVAATTLFTVHGCSATEVYAVGGFNVLRSSGDGTWTKLDVKLNNSANGVSCAPGVVGVVGSGGLKGRLEGERWTNDFTKMPFVDLHAVWAQSKDELWVVGGDFATGAGAGPRKGVVARFGVGKVKDTL